MDKQAAMLLAVLFCAAIIIFFLWLEATDEIETMGDRDEPHHDDLRHDG